MRFLYLRDPLFQFALIVYVLNREILKPHLGWSFCTDYLNDCLCIPFCVPIMLWLTRAVRLRRTDEAPHTHEILVPVIVWSIVFEVVLPVMPSFRGVAIADPMDVACYCVGAMLAAGYWRHRYPDTPRRTSTVGTRSATVGSHSAARHRATFRTGHGHELRGRGFSVRRTFDPDSQQDPCSAAQPTLRVIPFSR